MAERNLATAYVQIKPTTKGIGGELKKLIGGEASSAGDEAGGLLGSGLVGKLKSILAAAGIGKVIKDALDAGGALQQSFGGLDTLYGEASAQAKEFAMQAAQAGISANDYAEQAVSFGASLKQAFGGDTTKAVEAANTAIMDMADNAAKMGTPLESIQAAYQGFAKQNYTLLDNLKIGYGGTKSEMERLLKDAEKISGVKYDMSNLGDVYQAIHVIQEDLGLTGVAADEASSTFTGSMGAMKAAAENFLATLTTGGDVSSSMAVLVKSASTFLFKNLIPMVGNLVKAIPSALNSALTTITPMIQSGFAKLITVIAPTFLDTGIGAINKFIMGVFQAIPGAVQSIAGYLSTSLKFITANLPGLAESGAGMIRAILYGMMSLANSPEIGETVTGIFNQAINLLPVAVEAITEFADGIITALPALITTAGTLITNFASYILENLPTILDSGYQLLQNLVNGIIQNLPAIASAALDAVLQFLATVGEHLPEVIDKGFEILTNIATGIVNAIPDLVAKIPEVIDGIKKKFEEFDWGSIGKNIVDGIGKGLSNFASGLWESAAGLASGLTKKLSGAFKIGSPSKLMADEIGRWIPAGIAMGIEDNMRVLETALDTVSNPIYTQQAYVPGESYSVGEDISRALMDANENQNVNVNVTLAGDTSKIFKVVRTENNKFKTSTGKSAFNY